MRAGSYYVIEPGMLVVGPEGERIGRVSEVLVDEGTGIFAGLVVERGWFAPRARVPGERIHVVRPDAVILDVAAESLPRYQPPQERHGPPRSFSG